jgi:hypothetical protein
LPRPTSIVLATSPALVTVSVRWPAPGRLSVLGFTETLICGAAAAAAGRPATRPRTTDALRIFFMVGVPPCLPRC